MPEEITQSTMDREQGDLIHVCRSAWLTPAAYHFYRAILLSFPERGRPPSGAELEALALQSDVPLDETLRLFERVDLMQRHPQTGEIAAAYPFSGVPTTHRVHLVDDKDEAGSLAQDDGHPDLYAMCAMCAIDALGIPLMLRQIAWIDSRDAITDEPVRVHVVPTLEGPLCWSAMWEPSETVVYARPVEHEHEHDDGVAAADTCCGLMQFFVNTEHAAAWADRHAPIDGRTYTQDEALGYASALFAGVLDRNSGETDSLTTVAMSGEDARSAPSPVRGDTMHAPRVQVLYFASCPHTPRALALVRDVLQAEGLLSDVEMIAVETEEEADHFQFYGSPTVRVDGEDVCPPPGGATPSLACRLYLQPDGRMAPHPPAAAITDALRRGGLGMSKE